MNANWGLDGMRVDRLICITANMFGCTLCPSSLKAPAGAKIQVEHGQWKYNVYEVENEDKRNTDYHFIGPCLRKEGV